MAAAVEGVPTVDAHSVVCGRRRRVHPDKAGRRARPPGRAARRCGVWMGEKKGGLARFRLRHLDLAAAISLAHFRNLAARGYQCHKVSSRVLPLPVFSSYQLHTPAPLSRPPSALNACYAILILARL